MKRVSKVIKRLGRAAKRIYNTSPAGLVGAVRARLRRRFGLGASVPEITEPFLRSDEYRRLMSLHLPLDGSYDMHESQNLTRSFLARHVTYRDRLGVFRWRGMQKHLDLILEKVTSPGVAVLDFGGAACPLGFGSKVIDHLKRDVYGRRVDYHSLDEVTSPVDVIFSSHTLEHIEPLAEVLESLASKLKPGGYFLAHVPAFTCDRWWPGVHSNRLWRDHVWCFGLRDSSPPPGLPRYACIDELIAVHLTVELAEFCGDDSIFVVARRPGPV